MNILYTCDDNYVWLMGISMISIFVNQKNTSDINIYLLGDRISDKNKSTLQSIAKFYDRSLIIINVTNINISNSICSVRWPKSSYIRLFSGQLLPNNINKILYLDCDTIINSNLDFLWNSAIDSKVILGVKDCISKSYLKNIGLNKDQLYINAGVLLINLVEMRKINMNKEIELFTKKYSGCLNYSDQDILNGILKGKIGYIEPKYNVMTLLTCYTYTEVMCLRKPTNYYEQSEIIEAVSNPAIVHYTTCMREIRPWYRNSNHPFKDIFLIFKTMSPWKDFELTDSISTQKYEWILGLLFKLPSVITIPAIGIIHAHLKPSILRVQNKLKCNI